ncbi:MAG TPA: hypothetical protein VKT52_12565 [Ktedonobacterales bacterium]|nr:hypothetical protein [Ktedonobacterales bacterium]
MLRTARVFLGIGVSDPVVSRSESMRDLPEPVYVAALRAALAERGVAFLDVGYDVGRKARAEEDEGGYDYRRVYRVRSFVWDDALFVIRPSFAERHFIQWPDALQTIWRETLIDVPDRPGRHPPTPVDL